jgi:hypothetical protein
MRDLKFIVLLLLSMLILLVFFTQIASAVAPMQPFVPAPVGLIKAPMGNNSAREVLQMGTVYWGETIDMRLVVYPPYYLYNPDTGRIVDVSSFTRRILIDPDIFTVGEWDKYSQYQEGAGNNIAFYVKAVKPAEVIADEEAAKNETGNATLGLTIISSPSKSTLAKQHISDILVAKGDPLTYDTGTAGTNAKVWIFGEQNMLLDIPVDDGLLILNSSQTLGLAGGYYHLMVQTAGENTVPEAVYVKASYGNPSTTEHIESPFRSAPNLEIAGMGSQVVYTKFKDWLKKYSDDSVNEIKFAVQTPSLEISSIDEKISGNISYWEIQGYTNLAPGTEVRAIFDENKTTARTLRANTFTGIVYGEIQGDMREFYVEMPIDYETIPPGEHFVTVRSAYDTYVTVSRYVYDIPAGQEKPSETTRYSGGNIFVTPPTPEIIRVTIPGPETVRTVIVTITPVPTPTPVIPPIYLSSPWIYIEAGVLIIFSVFGGLWVFWKLGMI